jgi:hypothetical protein
MDLEQADEEWLRRGCTMSTLAHLEPGSESITNFDRLIRARIGKQSLGLSPQLSGWNSWGSARRSWLESHLTGTVDPPSLGLPEQGYPPLAAISHPYNSESADSVSLGL